MENASYLFHSCSNLLAIPAKLFANNSKITSFKSTFDTCSGLSSIPEGLFDNCPNVNNFGQTFSSCHNIKTAPVSLFDNNRKATDFSGTFSSCDSVSGESPYTVINGEKYHLYERADNPDEFVAPISFFACFADTNFSDREQMPNSWKPF